MQFSLIIPVYNRPDELEELLNSVKNQVFEDKIEVIVVEDGSSVNSKFVTDKYIEVLDIKYCFKKNSGPGDSRNYGMERASGDYYILLDSDCILPEHYLSIIKTSLEAEYVDAFGGPDAAHDSFTNWQKAINYSMTSLMTTGGLRSQESSRRKFQLRSFNMGLSKRAFQLTGGFSPQRIGEDIDLNFKLLKHGCSTRLISNAFVYHKRRTSVYSFFKQTFNFGAARPVLNKMHPGSGKMSYMLPSFFLVGFLSAVMLYLLGYIYGLLVFLIYSLLILIDAFVKTKNIAVSLLSIVAAFVQFFGYGSGFLRSTFRIFVSRMEPREAFPGMFS